MVARLSWLTGLVVGLTLAIVRLDAGGWAVVTLKDVPDYMVAGKPVSLTYAVRQHGVHLTPGLSGWIEARDARGGVVKALAAPASDTGYYLAKLTLPTPGDWTVTVVSGFLDSKSAGLAMRVVASGDQIAKLGDAERGKVLFAAKGCVTCHTHTDVSPKAGFAPDLSSPRFAAEYLTTFLADPSIKAPSRPGFLMPNLQLTHGEIGALVAFLSAEPKQAAASTAASRR
jgi:mono/diheme cytochrome c family protein